MISTSDENQQALETKLRTYLQLEPPAANTIAIPGASVPLTSRAALRERPRRRRLLVAVPVVTLAVAALAILLAYFGPSKPNERAAVGPPTLANSAWACSSISVGGSQMELPRGSRQVTIDFGAKGTFTMNDTRSAYGGIYVRASDGIMLRRVGVTYNLPRQLPGPLGKVQQFMRVMARGKKIAIDRSADSLVLAIGSVSLHCDFVGPYSPRPPAPTSS